jgi:hypothetical protein
MIDCQFESGSLRIENSGSSRCLAQLTLSGPQRGVCPLGARHRAAALVILAAVFRTKKLVAGDRQRAFRSGGFVVMALRHLRRRWSGNRFPIAMRMRDRHGGRRRKRGEHSREQDQQQRSSDQSLHIPIRRRGRGFLASRALTISPESEPAQESACRKHRAVLRLEQSPRRGRQKFDTLQRACPWQITPTKELVRRDG